MRTFVDLFSGAGLLSAGFISAGFRPLLAIDTDPLAVEAYRRNVAPVAIAACAKVIQPVRADLLIAGPPCQGFSTLGPRDPTDDRNGLCLAVSKWAAAINPAIVVVENVPPFVTSSQWGRMTAALRRLGYEIERWFLDAADYGTPQHRLRSFTIASRLGLPSVPRPVGRHVSAKAAFRRIRASDPMHVWPEPSAIAAARIAQVPHCGDWRDIVASAPKLCPPSWFRLGCQATDVWGRIDPARPANTLKSRFQNPSTGRYLHPFEDRVISLREGARLQGITDNWIFVGNREAMVRQIGNGVPLPLALAVAREIALMFENRRTLRRSAA